MVLAGDAAHPTLPRSCWHILSDNGSDDVSHANVYLDVGQRAAQGMEDGLALPITLCGASTAEEVEERLRLYEALRRNRASAVQILGNVGQDEVNLVKNNLLQYIPEDKIPS
jgi:salicylate hydroxylase